MEEQNRESQETSGRFRIVRRVNGVLLVRETGRETWTVLYQGPVGTAPLKGGNFGLRAESPMSTGELVLTEFIPRRKNSLKFETATRA